MTRQVARQISVIAKGAQERDDVHDSVYDANERMPMRRTDPKRKVRNSQLPYLSKTRLLAMTGLGQKG